MTSGERRSGQRSRSYQENCKKKKPLGPRYRDFIGILEGFYRFTGF